MLKKMIIVCFITSIIVMMLGCEGFKVLTLHNMSHSDIKVTTKPCLGLFDKTKIVDYPQNQVLDSSTYVLKPDSSIILLSVFTSMMFRAKIKERDLRINYLKIETENDIIIAKNRKEILRLLKNNKTRYHRNEDKHRDIANGKNWGNIFIRE